MGQDAPAKKGNPVGCTMDPAFAGMETEPEVCQEPLDAVFHLAKVLFGVGKEEKVIHVADILAGLQLSHNVVVEPIQIDIAEELGGLIAKRKPAAALIGSEEGIARKILQNLLLRIGGVYDSAGQFEGRLALDHATDVALQDLMVYGREIFTDVALEDEAADHAADFLQMLGGVAVAVHTQQTEIFGKADEISYRVHPSAGSRQQLGLLRIVGCGGYRFQQIEHLVRQTLS
jgi:hypothetical protein